ncbi:UNVERIFIED_CONTAM: hypothetical protein RMT77_011330 [Armadillidium vulgare]
MGKKFSNIAYNLSKNLIRCNEIVSLKDHALNLCIGNRFKDIFMDLYETMEKYIKLEVIYRSFYDAWKNMEDNVEDELFDLLKSKSCEYEITFYQRQTMIQFMGMQIVDFIKKRNGQLFFVKIRDFIPTMVFTSQGTVNMSKSVLQFNVFNNLTPDEIFRTKCNFFLENEIKNSYERLEEDEKLTITRYMRADFILEFWVLEIDSSAQSNLTQREILNNYEKAFIYAIKINNELAVEYLWNNRISQMDRDRIILETALKSIIDDSLKTNILMFLLFQVNENEFEEFFKSSSLKIIKNGIKEVRWHCVINKVFDVLKIYFDSDFVLTLFGILIDSNYSNWEANPTEMNLKLAVNYFDSLSESDKIYIIKNSTSDSTPLDENYYGKVLAEAISSMNQDEFLEKLLRFENVTPLKNYLLSLSGYKSLIDPAKTGCLYSFFDFLINILNKNDLSEIKSTFYHYANEIICNHFIKDSNFSKIKEFVDYFSEYDQTIQKFKFKIPSLNGGSLIKETLFPTDGISNYENLEKTNEVLMWCLNSNRKVNSFKERMNFNAESPGRLMYFDKILDCVKNSSFTFLNQLFEWKGLKTPEKTTLLQKLMNNSSLFTKINNLNASERQTFVNNFVSFLEGQIVISSEEINSFKQKFEERAD